MEILKKLAAKEADMYKADPITIAFLGDSVTHGCFELYKTGPQSLETVFEPKSAYSQRLREMFALLYPKVQINIINSGISGDNAVNGFSRLERDILRYHPDLVVVSYGLNDCGGGKEKLPDYQNALKGIFHRLREEKIETIFMTENMMNTHVSCHYTDSFFVELSERIANNQNNGNLDMYFDTAKETAKSFHIPVCDVYSKWKKLAAAGVDTTELLANKVNHPIREMNYLFAFSLIETIFEV